MKALKLSIAALLLALTFQAANAQVRVGLHVGPPPPRRVVVIDHHHYRHHHYYHRRHETVVVRHY